MQFIRPLADFNFANIMDLSSISTYAIALIIVASLLKRECNAEYGIPQLISVTHNSAAVSVVSNNEIAFTAENAELNPPHTTVATADFMASLKPTYFTGPLTPFTKYVMKIIGLKRGDTGANFNPTDVSLQFCTKPEPPTDFKVDDTVNPSSNQLALKWTQPATTTDEYEVYLDGALIKTLASTATNFTIASTDDADGSSPTPLESGTTYTCKLVAKRTVSSDSECTDGEAEPQIVGCSTASIANTTSTACTKSSTSVIYPKITLLCILVMVFFTE